VVLWGTGASQKGIYWVGLKIIDIDAPSQARLVVLGDRMASGG
jgi:hypothetical protein